MMNLLKDRKAFYNTTIPVDWDTFELNQVAEKIMVGIASAATHAYRNQGIILFRNQNIKEGYLDDSDILFIDETYEKAHRNKRLKGGDILIARTGYPGTACLVPEKYFGSQSFTTLIVRPRHDLVNKEYLCLYINSEFGQGYFETNQIGGGQKNVNAGTLETMPIPIPPFPEQKAIAQVLITADAAIQTTEKLIFQKELRKKWLMQQLLAGKKRLNGFVEEWKEIHIRDVAKEVSIRNKSDKQLTVLSCTKYDGLVPSLEYFGRKIFADDVSTYKIVPKNHFAYATNHIEEGSIGYQEILDEALISPMYTVFKTDKTVNDNFFYKLLKSHPLVYQYQNRMEGSIDRRGGLRWDSFSIIKIKLPSYQEQTAIAQVLQAADKEITLLKAKTEKLREQKKGLMQQLLTGKVRLKIHS
jgi:type I restriction enzyme S subunit